MTGEERQEHADLVGELLAPIPRTAIVPAIRASLGLTHRQSDRLVQAFDDFVAKPLAANLIRLHGRDLAKRNPMVYTVRGVDTVAEFAGQVLADKETSAIDAHVGGRARHRCAEQVPLRDGHEHSLGWMEGR
jgi:hypothetical protein